MAVPADTFPQRAVGENVLKAYINIGPAARLDFIVIGPAVNLVSRVESVAKAPDLPIVVSEAVARAYAGNLRSLDMNCGNLPDRMSTSRPSCRPA